MIITQSNYISIGHTQGEFFRLPSKTVPGMTLSLQELLAKYVRGEDVTVFTPTFSMDDELVGLERLDEMDRLDLSRELGEYVHATRSKLTAKSKELPLPSDDAV